MDTIENTVPTLYAIILTVYVYVQYKLSCMYCMYMDVSKLVYMSNARGFKWDEVMVLPI